MPTLGGASFTFINDALHFVQHILWLCLILWHFWVLGLYFYRVEDSDWPFRTFRARGISFDAALLLAIRVFHIVFAASLPRPFLTSSTLASSLDEVIWNRGFWAMISSIPLRYIAATCCTGESVKLKML